MNTYGYAGQNAIRYYDPRGLAAQACLLNLPACGTAIVKICSAAVTAIKLAIRAGIAYVIVDCNNEEGKVCPVKSESDEGQEENVKRPPPGSKPIDKTDWSGDHQDIKNGIGAGPKDSTKIDSNDNVWGQNPDGTWTNHGSAGDYTGSGLPSGRKGKNRR